MSKELITNLKIVCEMCYRGECWPEDRLETGDAADMLCGSLHHSSDNQWHGDIVMARPQIEFIVQPKAMLPSTDYDQIVAYVRDGVDCLDSFVSSQGDEILVAVSIRHEDALYAYVYSDLELTDEDKEHILEQIDWDRIEEVTELRQEYHDYGSPVGTPKESQTEKHIMNSEKDYPGPVEEILVEGPADGEVDFDATE